MEKQRKKRRKRSCRLAWPYTLSALVMAVGLSCFLQKPANADTHENQIEMESRQEELEWVSVLYHLPEEAQEPELIIKNEDGKEFELSTWETEKILTSGRQEEVSERLLYKEVEGRESIPATARIEVTDEESGISFMADLPVFQVDFFNETWDNDFQFTVTFHSYDADFYRLGELEIPHCEERPGLEGSEAELLSFLELDDEAYRILGYEWKGEPYLDPEGLLCRDAQAYGKKKTADCAAVYKGIVTSPDYYQYRIRAFYKNARKEPVLMIEKKEINRSDETGMEVEKGLWHKLRKMTKLCLEITIGMGCFLLAIAGFRILLFLAKKAKEKRDKWTG